MSYIPPIFELSVIGVFDAGVPHKERIVMRPTQAVDLSYFALIIGVQAETGVVPLNDFFRWLGPATIGPPSWLVVYTDSGQDIETTHEDTGEPVHIKHWGRSHTLFPDTTAQVVLGIIKIGGLVSWLAPKPARPLARLGP